MGKKYVPIKMNGYGYRVYLEDVMKVYKSVKKTAIPIPAFQRKGTNRKDSLETVADSMV